MRLRTVHVLTSLVLMIGVSVPLAADTACAPKGFLGTWDLYPDREADLQLDLSWGSADIYWYFGFGVDTVDGRMRITVAPAGYLWVTDAAQVGSGIHTITIVDSQSRTLGDYLLHFQDPAAVWIEPVGEAVSVFPALGSENVYYRRAGPTSF